MHLQADGTPRVPFRAVFWLYEEDRDAWKLIVATPLVNEEGPFEVYGAIDRILKAHFPEGELKLIDVRAVSPDDRLIQGMVRRYGHKVNASGERLSRELFGDQYVEQAVLYRVS